MLNAEYLSRKNYLLLHGKQDDDVWIKFFNLSFAGVHIHISLIGPLNINYRQRWKQDLKLQ